MKKIFSIFFLITSIISANCQTNDLHFLPASVGDHPIVHYKQFSLSYNEAAEQADWVAYELTREEIQIKRKRTNHFTADLNIKTKSANNKDYSSTGFDKGHLCPAANCKASEEAYKESFVMSNISPQLPLFNREVWKELETYERQLAMKYGKIWCVTGPVFIYGGNLGKLGANKVTIPSYFYKVILRKNSEGKFKSIAYLLPQVGATKNHRNYIVSVNSIETLTGIDFFPFLEKNENRIESQTYPTQWGYKK